MVSLFIEFPTLWEVKLNYDKVSLSILSPLSYPLQSAWRGEWENPRPLPARLQSSCFCSLRSLQSLSRHNDNNNDYSGPFGFDHHHHHHHRMPRIVWIWAPELTSRDSLWSDLRSFSSATRVVFDHYNYTTTKGYIN